MSDLFQSIDQMDDATKSMVADRLELRATQPAFTALRDRYLSEIALPNRGSIHELGCGTGVLCRHLAQMPDLDADISGSDLSQHLIDVAQARAKQDDLDIKFTRADAHGVGDSDCYDMVLAHTLLSHVTEPDVVLAEALRLTKPGGIVVIHDGDYASMTISTNHPVRDAMMTGAILKSVVANPHVMRHMPTIAAQQAAPIIHAIGDGLVEAGTGTYFPELALRYSQVAAKRGLVDGLEVQLWGRELTQSLDENRFFGSCNYITYVIQKPT